VEIDDTAEECNNNINSVCAMIFGLLNIPVICGETFQDQHHVAAKYPRSRKQVFQHVDHFVCLGSGLRRWAPHEFFEPVNKLISLQKVVRVLCCKNSLCLAKKYTLNDEA
jgi:hypothetical protein